MTTVALIGPDGSGKTSVARRLPGALEVPVRYLYMGVSAESSNVLLPTTRLARRIKRAMGAPPDRAGPPSHAPRRTGPRSLRRRAASSFRTALRLANRTAEEWYRQLVAWRWQRRGAIVLFDRHFFVDYHAYDVSAEHERTLEQRIHGALLARLPRPDLVIYLDAPAEVLLARKGEGSVEALERRRSEYRAIAPLVPRFVEIDATLPLDDVVRDVAARIREVHAAEARRSAASAGDAR